MGTSRRDFLKKGSLVALAAGVPISFAEQAMARTTTVGSHGSLLTKNAFAPLLDTDFVVNSTGRKVTLRLMQVSDLPRATHLHSKPDKEGFSLLFAGDRSKALKQNTYSIEHEKLGGFHFLLTPTMSSDKSHLYYEVVVNRLYP